MKTVNIREVPLSEIIDLEIYPVADLFPMLDKVATKREEGKNNTISLSELADSIIAHGLQEALVLYNGTLLDGRNRRAACKLAAKATDTPTEEFMVLVEDFEGTDEEADEFVFALNLDRRDLTPGQRAFVAVGYEGLYAGRHGGDRSEQDIKLDSLKGRTVDLLAQRFRVSNGYIIEAKKLQRAIEEKEFLATKQVEEAERQRGLAEEKKLELQAAVEAQAAKEERERINLALNEATNKAAEATEKAQDIQQEANRRRAAVNRVQTGNATLNQVKQEVNQDGKDDREIEIERASAKFNKAFTDLVTAGRFLLSDGRPNDQENVRRKFLRICEEFGDIEPFEGYETSEDAAAYWADVEADNADHGTRHNESGLAIVAHTKPCGCDFSGAEGCPECT